MPTKEVDAVAIVSGSKRSLNWYKNYALALRCVQANKGRGPTHTCSSTIEKKIYNWLKNQKEKYRNGTLELEQYGLCDNIPIEWGRRKVDNESTKREKNRISAKKCRRNKFLKRLLRNKVKAEKMEPFFLSDVMDSAFDSHLCEHILSFIAETNIRELIQSKQWRAGDVLSWEDPKSGRNRVVTLRWTTPLGYNTVTKTREYCVFQALRDQPTPSLSKCLFLPTTQLHFLHRLSEEEAKLTKKNQLDFLKRLSELKEKEDKSLAGIIIKQGQRVYRGVHEGFVLYAHPFKREREVQSWPYSPKIDSVYVWWPNAFRGKQKYCRINLEAVEGLIRVKPQQPNKAPQLKLKAPHRYGVKRERVPTDRYGEWESKSKEEEEEEEEEERAII